MGERETVPFWVGQSGEVEKQMKGGQRDKSTQSSSYMQPVTPTVPVLSFRIWQRSQGRNTMGNLVQLCSEMINQEKDASCIKDQPGGMCVGASVNLDFFHDTP